MSCMGPDPLSTFLTSCTLSAHLICPLGSSTVEKVTCRICVLLGGTRVVSLTGSTVPCGIVEAFKSAAGSVICMSRLSIVRSKMATTFFSTGCAVPVKDPMQKNSLVHPSITGFGSSKHCIRTACSSYTDLVEIAGLPRSSQVLSLPLQRSQGPT